MLASMRRWSRRKLLLILLFLILATFICWPRLLTFSTCNKCPLTVDQFVAEVERYKLNRAESLRVRQLATAVSRYLTQNRVLHFLSGGSALGAIRHGGVIPSDDDFDLYVCCNRTQLEAGPLSPARLAEAGLSWVRTPRFSKVFFSRVQPGVDISFKDYPWRWPFVDIFYLLEDKTRIYSEWDLLHPDDWFDIRKDLVVPVVSAEFEGVRMPVMRCSRTVLNRLFPGWMDTMCLGNWDHRREEYRYGKYWKPYCLPTEVLRLYNISFLDPPKNPEC